MVGHPEKISYPTGTWYQIKTLVEEQSKKSNISEEKIEEDIDTLVKNQEIPMIHTGGNTFINIESLSDLLNYYVPLES